MMRLNAAMKIGVNHVSCIHYLILHGLTVIFE